jgi:hypothetical protein
MRRRRASRPIDHDDDEEEQADQPAAVDAA